MAKIRTIKPALAASMTLANVSLAARYVFVLLISQSDDDGLQYGNTRQLLGSLFPHDPDITGDHIEGWIDELVTVNAIRRRITTSGAPVIEILGWHDHQNIDKTKRSKPLLLNALATAEETPAPKPKQVRPDPDPTRGGPRPPEVDVEVEGGSGGGISAAKPRALKYAWLAALRDAHEAIYGQGTFIKRIEGRFASAWGELHRAHGPAKCADVWRFSQDCSDKERKFRTPEYVAEHFADFDPKAPAFPRTEAAA